MSTVERSQQLRGQQHRAALHVTFGWQRQGEVRFFQRLEQIKADMPVTQLVAGQRGCQQHQRIILWGQLMQKRHKGFVQRAQPATFDPAREQQQQVVGTTRGADRQAFGCQMWATVGE